jgi:hypothetical protein
MSQGTILIIGGGGKTGARVNARLRAHGSALSKGPNSRRQLVWRIRDARTN